MKAVITGATKGIGRAIAHAFAAEGYDLCLCARSDETLKEVKADLKLKHPDCVVQIKACDFSSKEQVIQFAEYINSTEGPVDVLVNNVGNYSHGKLTEEEDGVLESLMQINVFGAYHFTRALLPVMKSNGSGHIFNICSISSKVPRADAAAYTISKFAFYGFSRVLSEEMRHHNIKVTAVLPGPTYTSSWKNELKRGGNLIRPMDIASSIVSATKMSGAAMIEELVIEPLDNNY